MKRNPLLDPEPHNTLSVFQLTLALLNHVAWGSSILLALAKLAGLFGGSWWWVAAPALTMVGLRALLILAMGVLALLSVLALRRAEALMTPEQRAAQRAAKASRKFAQALQRSRN